METSPPLLQMLSLQAKLQTKVQTKVQTVLPSKLDDAKPVLSWALPLNSGVRSGVLPCEVLSFTAQGLAQGLTFRWAAFGAAAMCPNSAAKQP